MWFSTGSVMAHVCKFYPSIGYEHFKIEGIDEDPNFVTLFFAKDLRAY